MAEESQWKGYLAVAAGFLTHLMIGGIFIWGNIVVYVTSYFRLYDPELNMEHTFILFPIQVILNNVIMYLGSLIALHWHPKIAVGLATICMFCGCFFSSYMTSWSLYFVLYGLVVTIGVGFGYTAPLIVAWSYFPEKKGRVSGLITCGFGFSAGIFNMVSTSLVNPDNIPPDIKVQEGQVTNYYYSEEIASNVPDMLRGLSYIWVIIGIVAVVLLPGLKKSEKKIDYRYPQTVAECVKDKTFYILVGVSFLASVYGIYCVAAFKIFGAKYIHDDQLLAIIGSTGNFINGLGRLMWAQSMDWVPFKTVVICLVGLQVFLSATVYWIVVWPAVYLIWIALSLACQGGIMSLFAAICGHVYGPTVGGKMTALVIYNIGIASVLVGLVQRFAIIYIGYFAMFYILCACSVISLLLHIFLYTEENKWSVKKDAGEAGEAMLPGKGEKDPAEDETGVEMSSKQD